MMEKVEQFFAAFIELVKKYAEALQNLIKSMQNVKETEAAATDVAAD